MSSGILTSKIANKNFGETGDIHEVSEDEISDGQEQ